MDAPEMGAHYNLHPATWDVGRGRRAPLDTASARVLPIYMLYNDEPPTED